MDPTVYSVRFVSESRYKMLLAHPFDREGFYETPRDGGLVRHHYDIQRDAFCDWYVVPDDDQKAETYLLNTGWEGHVCEG